MELELVEQKLEFGLWLGVAGELDLAAVGGGMWTSIICTAENFSSTLRGVSPGARAPSRRASVTCKQ